MAEAGKAHRGKFVAYYRVSTKRQGASGLGLAAQRQMVEAHLNGGAWELIAEFTEAESGKRTDRRRPELRKALELCKSQGATLIVAKMDRLSRNLPFLTRLLEAQVKLIVCDIPQMGSPSQNRFLLQLMANIAEFEGAQISERTTAALAAAKRRGTKLGTPDPAAAAKKAGIAVANDANAYARDVGPVLDQLEHYGCETLQQLADGLEARGIKTARGGDTWSLSSVRNTRLRWRKLKKKGGV